MTRLQELAPFGCRGMDRPARGQRKAGGDDGPGANKLRDAAGKLAPPRNEHGRLLDTRRFGISSGAHLRPLHPTCVCPSKPAYGTSRGFHKHPL